MCVADGCFEMTLCSCGATATSDHRTDHVTVSQVSQATSATIMPDFSANFHRPDTGIHTVEGNVAGSRAASLTRKREADQEAFEQRKKKIVADAERGKRGIDDKFDGTSKLSKSEAEFRSKTVGLCSAEDFRKAAKEAEELKKKKVVGLFDEVEEETSADGTAAGGGGAAAGASGEAELSEAERKKLEKQRRKERKKALKKKKKAMSTLSFAGAEDADGIVDDDIDDELDGKKKAAVAGGSLEEGREVKKNPAVDTSFLPDKDREAAAEAERLRLKREWVQKQKAMQNEMLGETSVLNPMILLISARLFNIRCLSSRPRCLRKKHEATSSVSFMDALSGLGNPRAFFLGPSLKIG